MKLIKINTNHYVVVDDSEIKENDWCIDIKTNTILQVAGISITISDYENKKMIINKHQLYHHYYINCKKITHSSQPLEYIEDKDEFGTHQVQGFDKIQYLPIQEVKELIGEVDVEMMADEKYLQEINSDLKGWIVSGTKKGFIEGYNQALEDNKEKKYTEAQMRECVMSILTDLNAHNEIDKPINFVWVDSFKKHIQSLQPKTQWEVEIVDGKLKLK